MRRNVAGRGPGLGFFIFLSTAYVSADPLNCALDGYRTQPGLSAALHADVLILTWQAERGREARIRLTNDRGTPTILDIAARSGGGPWSTVVARAVPEFRVVTGLRRI